MFWYCIEEWNNDELIDRLRINREQYDNITHLLGVSGEDQSYELTEKVLDFLACADILKPTPGNSCLLKKYRNRNDDEEVE